MFVSAVFGEMDGASRVHGIAFFQDHIYFSDLGRNVIWKSDLFGEKSEYTRRSGYQSDVKVIERRRG